MSLHHLDAIFSPRAIAVIGASKREGSVGRVLAENLFGGGFDGPILPVHPKHRSLHGVLAYPDIASLPVDPDLAVIATPAPTVPGLVRQLVERGARAVVILSAGFRERGADGAALERAVLDAAREREVRVVGPNCLGVLVPALGINASFVHLQPRAGDLAFVSQSGAIVAAMLDWAADRSIGFSRVVSLGNMADVDIGDLLDDLALDRGTRAVLLYLEAIADARKFMSAARAAARMKPVIVMKAGRAAEGARAVASHTGALAGRDSVYDAAFRRAGMLRVDTLAELFDAAATLGTSRRPRGNRLAILTNGGGAGVLATDSLVDAGGRLAELGAPTIERLDAVLGEAWSRGNPIDILAEAQGDRYAAALRIVLEDRGADAVLVLNSPSAIASSLEAARAVADVAIEPRIPVLATWLGGTGAEPARRLLAERGVPSYATPESATRAFLHLVEYRRNREELLETPPSVAEDIHYDRDVAARVIATALAAGRDWLLRDEVALFLSAYGVALADINEEVLRGPDSRELVAGLTTDSTFGPVIVLGQRVAAAGPLGGKALALPPLNLALARRTVERAHVALAPGEPNAHDSVDAVARMLLRISQIALDHGAVLELELDPLVTDHARVIAVDARVRVGAGLPPSEKRLAIRPYPRELEGEIVLRDGRRLPCRPIRPEDEPRLQEAFEHLTPEDVRLRFFSPLRVLHHDLAALLTQLDYDRSMAFVALEPPGEETSAILGVARLTADPDGEKAEYAVTVRSDWKGQGLGYALMHRIIDYARERGIRELFGYVLRDNQTMLAMSREMGFDVKGSSAGPDMVRVSRRL